MIPLHHVGYVEKGRTLASLVAQTVNNLPAIQETWVQSLGRKSPCRREWWPILVFLPQEFHGQMSLAGCSPWDRKESDRTEQLTFFFLIPHLTSFISTGILPSLFPWGLLGTFPHPIRGRVSWLGQNWRHRMNRISQHCSSQPLSAPRSPAEGVRRLGGHPTVGVNQSSKAYGLDSGEC